MALFGDFGKILGAVSGVFAGQPGALGVAGQIGSAVLAPRPASGPIPGLNGGGAVAQPAMMAAGPVARAISTFIGPVLIKIATKLGRRTMSVREGIRIARRIGKYGDAAFVATAMGITLGELANLIFAGSQVPRRRMNPANVKALRRSMRRLESFHRLCQRADALRGRGRRRSATKCGTGSSIVQVR